jgi:hypothetical protein
MVTDAEKVTVTQNIVSTAQKNPGWNAATDLQAAANVWSQSARRPSRRASDARGRPRRSRCWARSTCSAPARPTT